MGRARSAATARPSACRLQHVERWRRRFAASPQAWIRFLLLNALGRGQQLVVHLARFAAGAVPVVGDVKSERVGTQMRYLAKEIHRRLRITVFQLAIGRAHPANRTNLAAVADRRARSRLVANLKQRAFPPFAKTLAANVVILLVGDHANAHFTGRIDGAAVHAPAAEVAMVVVGGRSPGRRW